MSEHTPDVFDRTLAAGYAYHVTLLPSGELVQIVVTKPSGGLLNPVYGPLADGALSALDRAATIADEHYKLARGVL